MLLFFLAGVPRHALGPGVSTDIAQIVFHRIKAAGPKECAHQATYSSLLRVNPMQSSARMQAVSTASSAEPWARGQFRRVCETWKCVHFVLGAPPPMRTCTHAYSQTQDHICARARHTMHPPQ